MTAVTRQLQFFGEALGENSTADISVNGVTIYSGALAAQTESRSIIDLVEASYDGNTTEETVEVSITLTSGSASFGIVKVNQLPRNAELAMWTYLQPADKQNDGRLNILINGAAPSWPSDGSPKLPDGTQENPSWNGWCFTLEPGDVLTFDYIAMELLPQTLPETY